MTRLRQRQLIHIGLWALVLVLGARLARFTVTAAVRPSNGFAAYYTASRLVKESADVGRFYDDAWFRAEIAEYGPPVNDIYNLNPPTTALLLLPFAGLDYTAARIAWTLFNLACLIAVVSWLVWETGLQSLWIPGFIAFVLLYQPVYANFNQGQAYVLMLVLLAMAWHGYRRRRAWVLGVALGLMLVLKTAGVLLWLLLLVQGRWRALAWGAASALIAGLITLPWLGLDAWRTYFHLLPGLSARPELAVTAYQTLPGFVRHLLVFDDRWNPAPLFHAPALASWLVGLGFVVLAGLTAYQAYITDQADLIFAAFASASLILSPVSLDYHYTLLLLPIAILIVWAHEQTVAWPGIVLAAAMLLLAADLPYRAPQLAAGAWALLAYPTLYGAWLLWGLALWACRKRSSATHLFTSRRSDERKGLILKGLALMIVLGYWAISLDRLGVFPPVTGDEPWIAAAPYKLATRGVYGSDLFAGYYGLERHNYQHTPVYPLLLAGVFRTAGTGVFQMRFLPVVCGLLILPLVFAVGRQVGDERVGALAMMLLMGQRLAGGDGTTGVPLLDIARINRYDIAVPLFGLMAFWVFNRAERRGSGRWYVLSGVLIGMSSLSHLYGAFWLPALLLLLLYRRGGRLFRRREPYLVIAGFGLTWLPWVVYIMTGWSDYLGQMRFVAPRFDVLSPRFYLNNLLHEVDRYRPMDLFDPAGKPRLMRPGAWTAILGLPVAVGWMLWRGRHSTNNRAFALAVVLAIQGLMFATLLKVKFYNYGIALWPLAVLSLSWFGVWLWGRHSTPLLRGVLLLILAATLIEGGLRIAHRRLVAAQTTPYAHFEARVASYIPPGARVLGLQHYWLGLRQYPYRTWLLPALQADPLYYHESLTLDQALERVDPDVILLDRYMGGYFDDLADPTHPLHGQYAEFWNFMARHRATLAGVIEDSTYGTMRIYRLNETPSGVQRP